MDYTNMTKEQLVKHCERQDLLIQTLKNGIFSVAELIDNSDGVVGLHLNGELARWSDLREGGYFESWLIGYDDALYTVSI